MAPGYIAVIPATPRQVNPKQLYVKNDQLCYSPQDGATPVPLQGYDYILFRVEGRQERDDWEAEEYCRASATGDYGVKSRGNLQGKSVQNRCFGYSLAVA